MTVTAPRLAARVSLWSALLFPLACSDNTSDGDTSADTDVPAVCGDGIRHPDEACDDGNTKSGDGCSSHCELAGTVLACTTLTEGTGDSSDEVEALLPSSDGSFIASGSIEIEGASAGWIGRYSGTGERLWYSTPAALSDYSNAIVDLAEDPAGGYWALFYRDELLHVTADGEIDRQFLLADLIQGDPIVQDIFVYRLQTFDGRLWLAGGASGVDVPGADMWLGVLDPGGQSVTTLLLDDYAGNVDLIKAIGHTETEIAVAATAETALGHLDPDEPDPFPHSDIVFVRFDRNGVEVGREIFTEQPSTIATRAYTVVSDGEGGWVIAGAQYESAGWNPWSAWVTRVHPTSGWTWKSKGPYETSVMVGDLAAVNGEFVLVGDVFANSSRHSWMVGFAGNGQINWQRHESDAGYVSAKEHVAVANFDGRLRTAGIAYDADVRSLLRSCMVAQ
ncbi:MAG: DUF4215 domain-containing protein [Deltaproteobacteria bacterium]|nr:DUF4215 domain-containing protein [Deltaproteobacteria bacterium]